jgi:hypothetical protein
VIAADSRVREIERDRQPAAREQAPAVPGRGSRTSFDASEKAKQLHLHPDTLVRMARAGRAARAQKIEREWRFPAGSVEVPPLAIESTPPEPPRSTQRDAVAAPASFALGELTVTQLRVWQAELVKARVNAGTIDKSPTFLSSVLQHAAESEAIPGNPLSAAA